MHTFVIPVFVRSWIDDWVVLQAKQCIKKRKSAICAFVLLSSSVSKGFGSYILDSAVMSYLTCKWLLLYGSHTLNIFVFVQTMRNTKRRNKDTLGKGERKKEDAVQYRSCEFLWWIFWLLCLFIILIETEYSSSYPVFGCWWNHPSGNNPFRGINMRQISSSMQNFTM